MLPEHLKYAKTHEWANIDKNGTVIVGITDYAVGQLGDIVFLELPAPGKAVKKELPMATVESVKAAVDIYSPLTGEVVQANNELPQNLDKLTQDPYGSWFAKIKPIDLKELDEMMDAAQYKKFLETQPMD